MIDASPPPAPEKPPERVVIELTPKQQQAAVSTARFLLFGGGAGGGKTHWAIIDALGLNNPGPAEPGGPNRRAIDFADYKALFLRRTVRQLEDVIMRTKQYYPIWGRCPKTGTEPTWREQKKMWIFPSGATIFFGYVDKPSDVENYQGWQYHWICFEELTQWPSGDAFHYLHTRLRKDEGSPVHIGMRATCNPGGVGHHWVRSFWHINNVGDPTHFTVPTEIEVGGERSVHDLDRQFIPAKLDDNPYLKRDQYALSLAHQSSNVQKALREGRWDIVDLKGVVYADQITELHELGRIKEVPYDPRYPVNTIWDLGIADLTAIWFHQRVEGVDHFISYYEARNRGLKDHWKALQLLPYQYGIHLVPHDAGHRRNTDGGGLMTIVDIMEDLGMRNMHVVPKTRDVQQGIEQSRIVMPRCLFDWGACERGIQCLTNYRFKINEDGTPSMRPVHDEWSHGADAFRQFAQVHDQIEGLLAALGEEKQAEIDAKPWSRAAARRTTTTNQWCV